jgi:hypothetical protein
VPSLKRDPYGFANGQLGNLRLKTDGKHCNWNETRNWKRSTPSTITAPPLLESSIYTPDFCASSWIDYVRSDILSLSEWFRRDLEWSAWGAKYEYISTGTSLVYVLELTTSTWYWEHLPTQCDRFPRVRSTGESTWKIAPCHFEGCAQVGGYYPTATMTSSGAPPRPSPLPRPQPKPTARGPTCDIYTDQCARQWDVFQSAFRTKPLGLEALASLDSRFASSMLDINRWVGMRGYATLPYFFGNCSQVVEVCLNHHAVAWDMRSSNISAYSSQVAGWKTSFADKYGIPYEPYPCIMHVDRVVQIAFPPPGNFTRDLCAPHSFTTGGGPNLTVTNSSVVMTAVLSEITFPHMSTSTRVIPDEYLDLFVEDWHYSKSVLQAFHNFMLNISFSDTTCLRHDSPREGVVDFYVWLSLYGI